MLPFTRSALLLILALMISGCASNIMTPIVPLTADLAPYSLITVEVETAVAEDVNAEAAALLTDILSEVSKLERFQNVTGGDSLDAQSGLFIRATISKIRKVGGGARFFLGAFAGKASMTTTVEFIDASNHAELGRYDITEETGSTGLSGTTGTAVKNTAKKIAKILANNFATSAAMVGQSD